MSNLQIDGQDVTEMLKKAILESALGLSIKQKINDELNKIGGFYQSPIKDFIHQRVQSIVNDVISESEERIKESIRTALTDEHINKLVAEFLSNIRFGGRNY